MSLTPIQVNFVHGETHGKVYQIPGGKHSLFVSFSLYGILKDRTNIQQ